MRTIRVTGKGQIKVKPDVTRITLSLEDRDFDYAEALHKSSVDTERLKDLLEKLGFERTDLKTLSFDVDTKYESYKENDAYRQRFVGYEYSHVMKFEFDSDNEGLGRILYALAMCPVHPEFRISYTVKDPEKSKNELLGKAVNDAMQKAKVLTQAAGLTLKNIENIDYSWGQINFEVHPMDRMLNADCCMSAPMGAESYDMDIEPDDIEVSDTVTVVWEIE